jgi:mannose-6-phosphate isomerase-like protein (cupin superfamily)
MPFISAAQAAHFELHGAAFVGLASPTRGSTANSVWMVTLLDSGQAVPHRLTREETLVCIEGHALANLSGEVFEMTPGSAIVIPPETEFSIRNPHAEPFRAVAVLPVGGQVTIAGQQPFTPPWAC